MIRLIRPAVLLTLVLSFLLSGQVRGEAPLNKLLSLIHI